MSFLPVSQKFGGKVKKIFQLSTTKPQNLF